jgi:hypothetical protein
MSMTIDWLMDLRNGALDACLSGELSDADCRADVATLAVEMDRVLTPPPGSASRPTSSGSRVIRHPSGQDHPSRLRATHGNLSTAKRIEPTRL